MVYIQRKGNGYLETVDECTTRREALNLVFEYRASDRTAEYYLSQKPCKKWSER